MKKIIKAILVLTLLISMFVPATAQASVRHNKQLPTTTTKVFLQDLKYINKYEKAALKVRDMKTFWAGQYVEYKMINIYSKDLFDTSFENPVQKYLITYRFEYQRNSNPQFN